MFLIGFNDLVVEDEADKLKILKKKDKKSFQLKLKEVDSMLMDGNTIPDSNYFNYLAFIRARLNPQWK